MNEGTSLASKVPITNSGGQIPVIGYGVYQIDQSHCTNACLMALSAGYRQIDTAQIYHNEAEVGEALKQCGIPREEIFVTTKIRYPRLGKGNTYKRALQSVQKIDSKEEGYVDLFLIHSPYGINKKDRKDLWMALEKLHGDGKAKAIGVSNYKPEHIEEMREYATIWPPHVNQIQLSPWTQQSETIPYCQKHGILLQAFSPLAKGEKLSHPVVVNIAQTHNKSVAQVLIRYCLQKGWVPLPKSEKESRIRENVDVFDFVMSGNEMALLDKLDGEK